MQGLLHYFSVLFIEKYIFLLFYIELKKKLQMKFIYVLCWRLLASIQTKAPSVLKKKWNRASSFSHIWLSFYEIKTLRNKWFGII